MSAVDAAGRAGLLGRDDALARVARAVDAARSGTGHSVLVSGSAGMGKSALLRASVTGIGDLDLGWGTCVEGGGVPGYWLWTQALDGLVRRVGVERARAAAGDLTRRLVSIVPALGTTDPSQQPDPSEQSEREQLLLLDGAAAWLRTLAAERPILLLLDDLQWVDDSSLALLEILVRDPRPAAVSVLAAYRDDEVTHSQQGRLAALVARADHVHLTGLDQESSRRLVADIGGPEVAERAGDAIFRRAGGHPFFTRELMP